MTALRCGDCGRFIPDRDIATGEAMHRMTYPDSHVSCETWVTVCKKCLAKEKSQ